MTTKSIVITDWRFKESNHTEWLPAKVPGCVHSDLLHNEKILAPFYGKNELELQWIDKKDWEYETTFDIPEEVYNEKNIEIAFDGLDTYAEVYVNDEHVLSTNNMFRTWKANIRDIVNKQNNTLRVYFRSPINEDLVKLEKQGYNLPATNDHSEDGGVGDKNLSVFARKAPYHYGWDWGPRFVTSGIWKEVRVEGWSNSRITDFYIQQNNVTEEKAKLTARIEIESDKRWEGDLSLTTEEIQVMEYVQLEEGTNEIAIDVTIDDPKLWWSRGLGEQYLYKFTAALSEAETVIAEESVRTGLRSIRLVRKSAENGTSFYFELNGVPVFMKGANHIPNDSFETEVTYERYRHEIVSAVESNMNMLRVWGGGIYEYDTFYELCDEYGILVWQDFMFACSMYPGDTAFLENVKVEAKENVKRLRNHPSIALWCGNNEMDTAWSEYNDDAGWGWKEQYSPEVRKEIWNAYEAVFHNILPEVVQTLAPEIDYWPSSPMRDLSGTASQHATSHSDSGDIHYWDVWHGTKPIKDYKRYVGRFMSEYGFQSFPELKTVKTYAEEEDLELESDVMLHHQKNDAGNRLIKTYMDMYYRQPKDFPSFLYMSHVLQADAIEMAIEAHRMNKPYCMGTLYWQMNDCWPVASWASMDYYGRWKALQYVVKRRFRDVILSIDGTEKKLDFYAISDILTDKAAELLIKLYDFKGNLLQEYIKDVTIAANTSNVVETLNVNELLKDYDANKVVLYASLKQEGEVIDSKEHYFVPMKNIELDAPKITVEEIPGSNGMEYVLETNVLAKDIWLAVEREGIFTDNYFDLIPGIPKKVSFLARDNGNEAFIPANPGKITLNSMFDFIKQEKEDFLTKN